MKIIQIITQDLQVLVFYAEGIFDACQQAHEAGYTVIAATQLTQ